MAGALPSSPRISRSRRGTEESSLTRRLLIGVAFIFVGLFLVLPLVMVVTGAFSMGFPTFLKALQHRNLRAALGMTLTIAALVVPLNAIFGLAAAWAVTKFSFRGKPLLLTLIDLPFAVSPVIAGVMLIGLFGMQGYFGQWLREHNIQIIFAFPSMLLATLFVTFPFVARELIPLMQAQGSEQEQAALTLGANGWQTFWYVTLPSVKWGLLYGLILTNARAMGEFGAVYVVSSKVAGETMTLPLWIENLHEGGEEAAAFAVASLLAILALITLILKSWMEWRQAREELAAQSVTNSSGAEIAS